MIKTTLKFEDFQMTYFKVFGKDWHLKKVELLPKIGHFSDSNVIQLSVNDERTSNESKRDNPVVTIA